MKKLMPALMAVIVAIALSSLTPLASSAEKHPEKTPAEIASGANSMFFCGYCHILTYPRVIKKAHASWKESKHNNVACADCHYPPGELDAGVPEHRSIPNDKEGEEERKRDIEFMKTELEVLSRLVTILNMDESSVLRRPRLDDRSCRTRDCHPPEGGGEKSEYWEKKITFAEVEKDGKPKSRIDFTHKEHYDEKKWVKGDEMHCTTCHKHETRGKHFETSKADCFLCHFVNAEMNKDRAKCSLCHEIPTRPLQQQKKEGEEKKDDEEPITHKKLEENKVPCEGCHLEVVRGSGQVNLEKCLDCHDNEEETMKYAKELEPMHKEHVAAQTARCINCHEPVEHKKADFLDYARLQCTRCHPDHHIYQRKLLLGEATEEAAKTPNLMFEVKTNCTGCHVEEKTAKGEKVISGSAKGCVDCHTKRHEAMLTEWKDKIKEELESISEVQKDAEDAIEKAKQENAPAEKLKTMLDSYNKGLATINIVKFGNGVHNKKYSIILIDVAFGHFEDTTDILSEE